MEWRNKIIKAVKELGWSYDDDEYYIYLSKETPEGYELNISIEKSNNKEGFFENVYNTYDCYDPEYEACQLIENIYGHFEGRLYDYKEEYEDILWCKDEIYKIYENLLNSL